MDLNNTGELHYVKTGNKTDFAILILDKMVPGLSFQLTAITSSQCLSFVCS